MEKMFYKVEDVAAMLGVSKSKAYAIIRNLNKELSDKGFVTISGKVSKQYFSEKFYGFSA